MKIRLSIKIADGDDVKCTQLPVAFTKRHVFARHQFVLVEFETGFVIVAAFWIVVEGPVSAGLVNEMAYRKGFSGPEALYTASVTVCAPLPNIQMPVSIERCDQFIAPVAAANGELGIPGEFEANVLERHAENFRVLPRGLEDRAPRYRQSSRCDLNVSAGFQALKKGTGAIRDKYQFFEAFHGFASPSERHRKHQ